MLELDTTAVLAAATNLARLHQLFSAWSASYDEVLLPENAAISLSHMRAFESEAGNLGARLSSVAAGRLITGLSEDPCQITVGQAVQALHDIESRFADYLVEVRLFVLYPQEAVFLEPADILVEQEGFSELFPQAAFEVEEAAKCLALGRSTASAFHAMRMLEIGIRALAKHLGIEDPTKASEKNWNFILGKIKEKIDEKWPRNKRLPDSAGAKFEQLYAHLDAVRNPWRNATMHVENTYQPHEALHIVRCAAFFMRRLSELSDENGVDPVISDLLGGNPSPG